jgi:hypothetical protein
MSKIIYDILFQYVSSQILEGNLTLDDALTNQKKIWDSFLLSSVFKKNFCEIQHLIMSIAKEIDRKEKLKCQYCRIDEGFLVEPPVKAQDLCKKHRQEYEEQYIDRTFNQCHPGILSSFSGEEGMHCSAPPRRR